MGVFQSLVYLEMWQTPEKYNGGALTIFCLAHQDYHYFHSPVDGKISPMMYISGEYYTVNVCSFFKF